MRWVDALLETHPQCADFYCPLTKVVMFDPVIAEDGLTYERGPIEKYLEENHTSPCVRTSHGGMGFLQIGKRIEPNVQRKAALDRILRDYNHEDEPELLEWDSQGLQQYLPDPRSVALASPTTVVPRPMASPRAVADITSDLTKMFKVLDPMRAELGTLVNLTPPKIVVIGDESSGKSTVLEQLIRMPLFPRNKTFCTRLPIHVRLRRPDSAESATVRMSVITADGYREHGYDAETEETPCTISTAAGFHFVQDRMNELSNRLAGETGGIVSDRIIVLDVLHPEVPVIDLIDLPGIVSVDVPGVTPPGKVEAVERVISEQIDADRERGMTSFYLVVVPCVRPNCSNTFKLIQREGLLDHAIGVLTKVDEVKNDQDLLAWIKGEDIEDEDDGSVHTAAELGQVALAKGWTATMLEMPKRIVTTGDGKKVNYYAVHAVERLKKQEEAEKHFFGHAGAPQVMRTLYDEGYAGTGALAAKLTFEYFEYTRGDWLRKTLARLLEYELELRSDRALLGTTDRDAIDELAAKEVDATFEDTATKALTAQFVSEMLIDEGALFPTIDTAIEEINGKSFCADEVDRVIGELKMLIQKRVAVVVEFTKTFYAGQIKGMLNACACVTPFEAETEESKAQAPTRLSARWYKRGEELVRSIFGSTEQIPRHPVELHKRVVAKPIVQLSAYPEFTDAVARVVLDECNARSKQIEDAAEAVIEHLGSQVSQYLRLVPNSDLTGASIHFEPRSSGGGHGYSVTDALKMAFVRFLPHAERLKAVMRQRSDLKLSDFREEESTMRKRQELNDRLARVRSVTRGLIQALDVDTSKPLDRTWLASLQTEHGLPLDDQILYTDHEIGTALAHFEAFHRLAPGSAKVLQLQLSHLRIDGWLRESQSSMARLAAQSASTIQASARKKICAIKD